MADDFDETDDDDTGSGDDGGGKAGKGSDFKSLREKAKRADAAEAKAADLEKKLADIQRDRTLDKLGIDTETREGKLALKVLDGVDTSDPKVARAALEEYGLLEPEVDEKAEAAAAQQRITKTATGATPSNQGGVKPTDYASWPREKRLQFRRDHPDAFKALQRGETVQVSTTLA